MLQQITYFQILGKPLIMWLGILTLLSFLATASIAIMNKRGIRKIPFNWHPKMAYISIALAVLHAILGIANFL